MNSYIRGNVREVFYKTDKGYMVGIFKIRETNDKELESFVNRTITFNGNFNEIINDSEYKFYGEVARHPKYGLQYKVSFYEKLIPEKKYTIASHNYLLLDNGSGATMFDDSKIIVNNGMLDVEMLEIYITEFLNGKIGSEYSESQNRIIAK